MSDPVRGTAGDTRSDEARSDEARSGEATAPAADPAAWLQVIEADAAAVGAQLQGLDKADRQRARGVLWQAYALRAPPADETGPEAAPEAQGEGEPVSGPTAAEILALQGELQALRRLVQATGTGVRPLRDVWLRRPLPERLPMLWPLARTQRLTAQVQRHFGARLALTPARLQWFEQRCAESNPTRVATVRQPERADESRDSLELLYKAGRTKFS